MKYDSDQDQMLDRGVGYFFKRLRLRWMWSWAGIAHAWRVEHSFRSWVYANAVSIVLTLVLPLDAGERGLIWALGLLVLASELVNTAIEAAVDRISLEQHELSRIAKDAGSGAVMVTAFAAGAAWLAALLGLAM
ncbi:MAG: diacylglycerol kinase [Shimia sp.]